MSHAFTQPPLPVAGVKLATTAVGVRAALQADNPTLDATGRDDMALLVLDEGTTVAGTFTQNSFAAPPVLMCRERIGSDKSPRAFVINSGNANAATGAPGRKDAEDVCSAVAQSLALEAEQVLPFSTGVIGERLPVPLLVSGIATMVPRLAEDNWDLAATAIMTTDTFAKTASARITIGDTQVTITGIAKGSGMIKPNMATMLAYIACDASVDQQLLSTLLQQVTQESFNRVTVDGDTSTNDSFMLAATGCSGAVVEADSEDVGVLRAGIAEVAQALAKSIAFDAEGATKLVTVEVAEAADQEEALAVAYTIAESPLVKTALFAGDPNWGRFCMAIGRAGIVDLDVEGVSLHLDDVPVAQAGLVSPDYSEAAAAQVMNQREFTVSVRLGRGDCRERVWTSDLSYDYVRINAEYRT